MFEPRVSFGSPLTQFDSDYHQNYRALQFVVHLWFTRLLAHERLHNTPFGTVHGPDPRNQIDELPETRPPIKGVRSLLQHNQGVIELGANVALPHQEKTNEVIPADMYTET